MRKILLLVLSIISVSLLGQNFNYTANIEKVTEDGFSKIFLSPELTCKLNPNFFDIRIYDSHQIEIPYILYEEQRVKETELFIEYEIIEKEHFKEGRYTRIVIHNADRKEINNIVLRIKNADVRKNLKLNASNDKKNWYVLKDNYYYNSIINKEYTSEIRVLKFPLSDYEYYELLIEDYFDKPINITQTGYYDLHKENGKYTQLDHIRYFAVDTLKETIISIPLKGHYLDKISFEIDSPKYYLRDAELFINKTRTYKKRKTVYQETLASFTLISNSSNVFSIDNLQADSLFIRIKNYDNPPLKINDFKLFQLNKYLIAELNSNQSYVLNFSDKKAKKANYDLKYFSDSIPYNINVIQTYSIEPIVKPEVNAIGNFNLNNYWLWIIIGGLAILLSYMSFKMITDKDKE